MMNIVNINTKLLSETSILPTTNRAFLYADALFDTLIFNNNLLVFFEEHYFRLLASMRQLRMDIPSFFTQNYWEEEILKTIKANGLINARIRTTIYRESKGLYTPDKHDVSILIQASSLKQVKKTVYTIGLYKDHFLNTNTIDNLKTTNRIYNVLASVYAQENDFDNCIMINHQKQVAEAINANIFLVVGKEIRTPKLSSGCINGVIRQKVIDSLKKSKKYTVKEVVITPFDLQNADEVFLTNSVIGVQSVTRYKRKTYTSQVASFLFSKVCRNDRDIRS